MLITACSTAEQIISGRRSSHSCWWDEPSLRISDRVRVAQIGVVTPNAGALLNQPARRVGDAAGMQITSQGDGDTLAAARGTNAWAAAVDYAIGRGL